MPTPKLPAKLRRIVPIRPERGGRPTDFDLTFTPEGIVIRLAGTSNRKTLFRPWHEILDGCINRRKGYRVYGMESAIAQLEDVETTLKKLG